MLPKIEKKGMRIPFSTFGKIQSFDQNFVFFFSILGGTLGNRITEGKKSNIRADKA